MAPITPNTTCPNRGHHNTVYRGKDCLGKWGRIFSLAIGLSATMLTTSGCASNNEIKWSEEVQLHDGSVVQVKRRTELSASGFPIQSRGFAKFHELCYAPMGVYWKSKPEYRITVFDIVDGKPTVKVPVQGCTTCMLQGYPAWDAVYFEWDRGAWRKVEENEKLRGLRFNLLSQSHILDDGKNDARGLITLAEKRRRDGSIYESMRVTGRTGPGLPIGECQKCKSEKVETSRTSDVLILSDMRECNW